MVEPDNLVLEQLRAISSELGKVAHAPIYGGDDDYPGA